MATNGVMEYLPRFAVCRDIRHQWDIEEWKDGKRVLVCWNCTARRVDNLDGYAIVNHRYHYPKGYSFKRVKLPIVELRRQLAKEATKLARWVGVKKTQKAIPRY